MYNKNPIKDKAIESLKARFGWNEGDSGQVQYKGYETMPYLCTEKSRMISTAWHYFPFFIPF